MQFSRLRLNGFKSFVDPTDLVIRDGLTGIVGPNGCGKSNLLEALRWVMGENRPTAMRGTGMADVIFAGSARRPARAHAEVSLLIDNRDRRAPAALNEADSIEITRRIGHDAGSVFRANGREVRARDVQTLFADVASGAHSPSLVRQGQIGELINARPQARRRILEEAAGIGGLYQRRHEALLKLDAAEANLARVGETLDALARRAAALMRQARAAARYRELGAALREAEAQLLWRHWSEAEAAGLAAAAALAEAERAARGAEAAAGRAQAARETAEAALPPIREEADIARALLARAQAEAAALDGAMARAKAEITALAGRISQIDADLSREQALSRDADETMSRLRAEQVRLMAAGKDDGAAIAAAQADLTRCEAMLRDAEARFDSARGQAVRIAAQRAAAEELAASLRAMHGRVSQAAEAAASDYAQAEAAGARAGNEVATAIRARDSADGAAQAARRAVDATADALAEATGHEGAARDTRATAEGEARALSAEVAALEKLLHRGEGPAARLLDQVSVEAGFEAALGAALGDDLRHGLADASAEKAALWYPLPRYDSASPLPDGTSPLAPHVTGPAVLARRLAQIGLVADAETGARLQPTLRPGQRLVTLAGDLWRWDGLAQPAGGQGSAAALHLQTVNRLAEARAASAAATARADARAQAHDAARETFAAARTDATRATDALRVAERALTDATGAVARAEAARDVAHTRGEAARAQAARHDADLTDAARRLDEAERALAGLADARAANAAADHARMQAEAARVDASEARRRHEDLRRARAARARRCDTIAAEVSRWQDRLDQAAAHAGAVAARRQVEADALLAAEKKPGELATRRDRTTAAEAAATARLAQGGAALSAAEATAREAVAVEREADRAASALREQRALCEARAGAATEAEAEARQRIRDEAGTTPDALAATLALDRATLPDVAADMAALRAQIARLRTERERLGAVNLRADADKRALEDEQTALAAERDDLDGAIRTLRGAVATLNREGRGRLLAAFDSVDANFRTLFTHLFGGGEARLTLVESDDPLDAGLEIICQPPGKKLSTLSLMSGGEQTLTALALIFAVFLANPAPICVLDEVDAPLDDANVTRFCALMDEMTRKAKTRFLVVTHHGMTMARMDRLYGVTMAEQGVSQLVSVDLRGAEALVA